MSVPDERAGGSESSAPTSAEKRSCQSAAYILPNERVLRDGRAVAQPARRRAPADAERRSAGLSVPSMMSTPRPSEGGAPTDTKQRSFEKGMPLAMSAPKRATRRSILMSVTAAMSTPKISRATR